MTAKRDKKDQSKAAKRPKLKKETLKDLDAKDWASGVRGGGRPVDSGRYCQQDGGGAGTTDGT